jgi:hypothetical protein
MAPAKKQIAAAERLKLALSDLAATEGRTRRLIQERREALAADDVRKAAHLEAQIDEQKRLGRAFQDKLRLIEAEIAEAERQQREKELQEKREHVSAILDKRLEAARRLAASIEQSVKCWREMAEYSLQAYEAYPWQQDHGAALFGHRDLGILVITEMWRVGGVAPWTGSPVAPRDRPLSYPGAKSPNLMSVNQPETLPSLVGTLETANNSARAMLSGGERGSLAAGTGSPATRLGALLEDLDRLSRDNSPEGEKRYAEVVGEIEALNRAETANV